MNILDLAAILILIITFFAGLRSGFLPQLGGLLGALLGGFVAIQLLPLVRGFLEELDPSLRALIVLGGLLFFVAIGEATGSTLALQVRYRMSRGLLTTIDSLAGAGLGLAQGILVIWLAGGLLAAGPLPTLAAQAQRSVAVRTLDGFLPPPTRIAGELSRLLDATGLPEVFIGLEPLPAPAPDLPADPQARAIAEAAIPSTIEVQAIACTYQLTGSGFVVEPEYVVTNAHVVAGSRAVSALSQDGALDATVVLFDAELDVALLYVPGLEAPALSLAADTPRRGEVGVAIGYPNGGPLTVTPGAVANAYPAEGLDLYGTDTVRRNVIELRAMIHRGNSGGPFVTRDGTVGGVVFAQSRSDPSVGYALDPVDVANTIEPALDETEAVGTGPCVR